MKSRFVAPSIMIGVMLLTGCSSMAQIEKMVVSPGHLEKYQGNTKFEHGLIVKEVEGADSSSYSLIGNKEFKEALIRSLDAAQLLSHNPPGTYSLVAKFVYVRLRMLGGSDNTVTNVQYTVLENATNKEIYKKLIRGDYITTMRERFSWSTDLQLATEGAARENIKNLINDLYQIR